MTAVGAIGLPAIARRISRRLFASLKGERRGTEAETVGQGAAAIGRCRVCFCCLVAPARTFLPSLPYIISAASRPHHHLHRRQPRQSALQLAIMGGGDKIPYAHSPNGFRAAGLTAADTQSTSGRQPEVGTLNPPTGKPTRPSWAS